MKFILKSFENLSPIELYDAMRLRQNVFVIEQHCFYEDMDGSDPKAFHLLLYDNNILAAYLRIFDAGIKFKEPSIGRIIVSQKYRGTDVGKSLIKEGINIVWNSLLKSSIRIEAQSALLDYYKQFGFMKEGTIYQVDGINHIQMVLKH